jgi:hypothetical protein
MCNAIEAMENAKTRDLVISPGPAEGHMVEICVAVRPNPGWGTILMLTPPAVDKEEAANGV